MHNRVIHFINCLHKTILQKQSTVSQGLQNCMWKQSKNMNMFSLWD